MHDLIVFTLCNAHVALLLNGLSLDLVVKSQNWESSLPASRHQLPMETCCLLLARVKCSMHRTRAAPGFAAEQES